MNFPRRKPTTSVVRVDFHAGDRFAENPIFTVAMRFQIAGTYIQCNILGQDCPVAVRYTLGGKTVEHNFKTARGAHEFCMSVRKVGLTLSNLGKVPEVDDEQVLTPYAILLGEKPEKFSEAPAVLLKQHNYRIHLVVGGVF